MLEKEILEKYVPVIGLEIHAQLSTKTKMFSPEKYEYGLLPNTTVSNITIAHPGAMPSINKSAIEFAIKMGLACNTQINKFNVFARKNYFYPDLPKGYQISQHENPICFDGFIIIDSDGKEKKVGINRIHIEEDTGKSLHNVVENKTLLDFNRAGAPLIEIVTEPQISNSKEAYLLLHEIRKIVRYLEICDGNMEQGSLRCDANVSVMEKGAKEFGKKVEVKNMNSMKNVQLAIEYEIFRQISLLENNEEILSETRSFDAEKSETFSMRLKETSSDYRYFIEPDLSPIEVSEEWLNKIKTSLPILPRDLKNKFSKDYDLNDYDINILIEDKEIANYFQQICDFTNNFKSAANWVIGPIKSYLNDTKTNIIDFEVPPKVISQIIKYIDKGEINFSIASQKLFPKLLENPKGDISNILIQQNLLQQTDEATIFNWVEEVIKQNPEKHLEYKNGKKGLFAMFMGEIMKKSKGKANPKIASRILQKKLEE